MIKQWLCLFRFKGVSAGSWLEWVESPSGMGNISLARLDPSSRFDARRPRMFGAGILLALFLIGKEVSDEKSHDFCLFLMHRGNYCEIGRASCRERV